MYHEEFTGPNRETMRLIVSNRLYFEAYLSCLLYMYDLICELTDKPQHPQFTAGEIYEIMAAKIKPKVFINYRFHNHFTETMRLADALRKRNINTWVWLPGTGVPSENTHAFLNHSDHFLVMISRPRKNARYERVETEWNIARQQHKQILIVVANNANREYIPPHMHRIPVISIAGSQFDSGVSAIAERTQTFIQESEFDSSELPFTIVENVRQNFDAARRIWLFGYMPQNDWPQSAMPKIEDGTLNVQRIATQFANRLHDTYRTLQTIDRALGIESLRFEQE